MVHESVADRFIAELKKILVQFYGENPQDSPGEWLAWCECV